MTDEPKAPRPPAAPKGLGPGGRALWRSIVTDHPELDGMQRVQLTEACRMKDRCDKLDAVLRGDTDTWMDLVLDATGEVYDVRVTGALSKANETANSMKQLLAALRLPDAATGKRPQQRGPRGAQKPTVAGGAGTTSGKVSSIDRARERAARKSS